MENVNKIQIRLDSITTNGVDIKIPFSLDFLPVDNTELQETEFVEKEKEKAINPIIDTEKYQFFPTFKISNGSILDAYTVEYVIDKNLDFLGLTDDDILYDRQALRRTYLRLNFYDSDDLKTQRLFARETIHLKYSNDWVVDGVVDQTKPLVFKTQFRNLFFNSTYDEGYSFYWFKQEIPKTLYMRVSLMNAKTGKVINLYSTQNPVTGPIEITSNGYNYIRTDFYTDFNRRQQYYYIFNGDNRSYLTITNASPVVINNKITVNLKTY